jgi:type II secretory pathway pseudopilin PulG
MEVLVVVAIIVVLAGIATVSFKYLSSSNEKAALAKMKNIETAITAYRTDHGGQLPPTVEALTDTSETGQAYMDVDAIKDPWGQYFQLTGDVSPAGRPQLMSAGEPGKGRPIYNFSK